jgi:uncharacterized membrane protein
MPTFYSHKNVFCVFDKRTGVELFNPGWNLSALIILPTIRMLVTGWMLLVLLIAFALSLVHSGSAYAKSSLSVVTQPQKEKGFEAETSNFSSDRIVNSDYYGVVIKLENEMTTHQTVQHATIRLDSQKPVAGVSNNQILVHHPLGENPSLNTVLQKGSRVLLTRLNNTGEEKPVFYVVNHDRTPALLILGSLLVLGILLVGGTEVFKHTLLLVLMLTGCYKALFPAVLYHTTGINWIILMCFMFTILASFIYRQAGEKARNHEQSVIILGTLGGLILMALIMTLMQWMTPLSGFSNEGLAAMWYEFPKMDYWMLYLAGCLFGVQGLLFYVCWTLIQSRKGLVKEYLGFRKRFNLVMLRGRRLLGPIFSSVGLLMLGLFMPTLIQLQDTSTAQFINLESTASSLLFIFAALLTVLLTVPLTALLAAWLLEAKPEN